MNLLVAPPGAGKTSYLLTHAREAAGQGKRVWWVGLPSQRSYLYRRATEAGALLGLEFLSSQQVYYRLLAHALELKPLIVGTGRIALVGEALLELRQELPAPGEARLFTQAIAEAKRFGLRPHQLHGEDSEIQRFREVFKLYEAIKGERWDYDDFRREALRLAETRQERGEADLIMVDGFREVGPLELRLYKALARHSELWLALPEAPPGETPSETLAARKPNCVTRYRAANPVIEARWVLRSLKRDLAEGMNPLDLAVILPEREVKAFASLADEYGVPLMDETPKALSDTLAGRILMDLLELPDYPTASRLLAIPELVPLANAALNHGVAGVEATRSLAQDLGLAEAWQRWQALLRVSETSGSENPELAWAESLVRTSLPDVRQDLTERTSLSWEQFEKHALERAKEASSLAKGAHFRKWWAALLSETFLFDRPKGGVALLTAKLVSGRRFKKAYLLHAVEGAYTVGEGEDYFVSEDDRQPLAESFKRLGLPKRFLGRDAALYKELLSRADEMVVTYAEASQSGPLVPEPELVGQTPPRLPEVPAGSRLELPTEATYRPQLEALELGSVRLQKLKRYSDCPFRYWANERIKEAGDIPEWLALLGEMRNYGKLNAARLELLKSSYPEEAAWLHEHSSSLMRLNYGVTLPEDSNGFSAYLDAAARSGSEATLYRFVRPGAVSNAAQAEDYINGRWNELWAAGHMLERYKGRVTRVHIKVWPLRGEPIDAFDGGIAYVWKRISRCQDKAQKTYASFAAGDVTPKPGFHCRECRVFDVCRVGQR